MTSFYKSFSAYIQSITRWEILTFMLILLMIVCFIKRDLSVHLEGFEQKDKYKVYENDAITLVLLHQLGRDSLFPIHFFNCHEFILSRIAIATERCTDDGSPTVDLVRKASHFRF